MVIKAAIRLRRALLASALLASCTAQHSREGKEVPVVVDDWRERLTSSNLVVLTLFVTESVIGVDPHTLQVARIADLDTTEASGPNDTAASGAQIFMADSPPGGFGTLDTETGSVRWNPRPTEVGFAAAGVSIGPDGAGYVTANYAAPKAEGVLFKVDLETLEILDEAPLPYGQEADVVFNEEGRFWAVANEGPAAQRGVTVSSKGRATLFALRGSPLDLAMTPWGNPIISIYNRDLIVEVDDHGDIVRSLDGFESFPWGLAVDDRGKGVVVAEGIPGEPGAVYFVDFRQMRILGRFVVKDCQAPREGVIVGDRAVISCLGPPSVLVLDLNSQRLVKFISLEEWTNLEEAPPFGDEPRGLSVFSPSNPT